ncbi:hypothetical protein MXB_5456, partial [Myxobolus squamalis]
MVRIPDYMCKIDPFDAKISIDLERIHKELSGFTTIYFPTLIKQHGADDTVDFCRVLTAIQSLGFVVDNLIALRPHFLELIDMISTREFDVLYIEILKLSFKTRNIMVHFISQKAFNEDEILSLIANTRFDLTEITAANSEYIDVLIK